MLKLTYGVYPYYPGKETTNLYELHSPSTHPVTYTASDIISHTISASSLYKYIFSSSTMFYRIVEFRLIHNNIVYNARLKRASPYTDEVHQHEWRSYMRADSIYSVVNIFKYHRSRLIKHTESPVWTPTDIVYEGRAGLSV